MDESPAVTGEETQPQGVTGAVSLMDGLRRRHQELSSSQTVDLSIPGYDGDLVARYRVLDVTTEIKEIAKRVAKEFKDSTEAAMWAGIDGMIVACVGLFAQINDQLVPLGESFDPPLEDDNPVKYDIRLAQFMGFENAGTAREVVMELFRNEVALMEHSQMLARWMGNTSRRVNEDFLAGI